MTADRSARRAYMRQWLANRSAEWRAARAAYFKKWSRERESVESKERRKGQQRAYNKTYVISAEQKAKYAPRRAQWRQENRARLSSYVYRRRARLRANVGIVSPDIASQLFAIQEGECMACCASLASGYELDHIIPMSKGGAHTDSNFQLLCVTCNRRKGARSNEEFLDVLWRERGWI